MAVVVSGNQVKLDNGTVVSAQQGGWYDGQQFWGGSLSNKGQINAQSNQQGAGQQVSQEVVAQTNPANVAYLQQSSGGQYSGGGGQGQVSGAGLGAFGASAKPTINLQDVYNQAFKSQEIADAEKAVNDAQVKIDEQTTAFNQAMAIINDNPFYSEATRVGKIRQLQEKYNADIVQYQNAKALAADALAKKQADAQVKVNLAMQQYDIDNQAYKDTLSQFNAALSAGALINANGSDIAQYAQLTGLSTGMIENIIAQQKRDLIKPQLITQTDDYGNTTLITVDANTGNIINQTSLGTTGKSSGSSSGGLGSKSIQSLRNDIANNMVLEDVIKKYVGVVDQGTIMSIYNSTSPWGPAKQNQQQINEMFGGTKATPLSQLPEQARANINWLKDQIKSGLMTRDEAIQQVPDAAAYL